ncbi:hypothetical protein EV193_11767 [Herbihabitans rhizosphaerae]|uniref:Uncharacterized protein n=1 Tax=Herbihabitans rhizosphaerae TaxID=1872711 RepID=A0A4Q7KEA6_9PSEU|nr:hypothetical protein [Herbihabitans rhizosphaerae]RZS30370.1 hypothetical protein EV193_11767 [Herbihabitans rhizosphaerae]
MPERARAIVMEEAIQTAWESVQLLNRSESQEANHDHVLTVLEAAVNAYGRREIARGVILLIGSLLESVAEEGKSEPHEDDPLSMLYPALMRQIRIRFPGIPSETLPMIGATVTAALLGEDAVAWRDQFGEPDGMETFGLTCMLWLIADFFDSLKEPGFTDQLVRDFLN